MGNAAERPQCRRKTVRIDTDLTIFLKTSEGLKKAVVKNLSEGGIFLQTDHLQPISTELYLHLLLPDSSDASKIRELEVKGVVTWVNPKDLHWAQKGMGIKFADIRKDKLHLIRDYIDALIKSKE